MPVSALLDYQVPSRDYSGPCCGLVVHLASTMRGLHEHHLTALSEQCRMLAELAR